jgi:hypothetical protein
VRRLAIIGLKARPIEFQSAIAQRVDHVREVPVLSLAGENFVADDQRADGHEPT